MSTVLVVDNTPICRELLAAALSWKKYQVRTAANGREALVAVGEELPDLILTELDLPELDGLAVMRVLRSNPQYKDIPCIVLTTVADRDRVLESRKLGVNEFMLKPRFCLDDLLARMKRVLADKPVTCKT